MTKKPTKAEPRVIERAMDNLSGQGLENISLMERAFWLEDRNSGWYEAFQSLYLRGDKIPLIAQLRRGRPMEPAIQSHLADLIEVHELTRIRPRGRPALPRYDKTPQRALLLLLRDEVKRRCDHGAKRDQAIEDALLSAAGKDTRVKGSERLEAIAAAGKEIGITLKALINDLNRGRRYKRT